MPVILVAVMIEAEAEIIRPLQLEYMLMKGVHATHQIALSIQQLASTHGKKKRTFDTKPVLPKTVRSALERLNTGFILMHMIL